MYIFILFTLERNFQRSLAVASRPLTLSRQRRLYLHPANNRGSIFLPPLACGFTLPQGDSRWRSPISSCENLGLSLLNTHYLQHLGHTFSSGHNFIHLTLICFYFTLCHPYVFSAFAPLSLSFQITVWV